jgi:heme/copper-type cytochrome/quinol oxidase subunit 2
MVKIKNMFVVLFTVMALMMVFGGQSALANGELPFNDQPVSGQIDVSDKIASDSAVGSIVNTMYTFANYITAIIFGISVIMIVFAGLKYATSQGEQRTMETAKMQIITAGIGIGVAVFAMIITRVFAEIYGL